MFVVRVLLFLFLSASWIVSEAVAVNLQDWSFLWVAVCSLMIAVAIPSRAELVGRVSSRRPNGGSNYARRVWITAAALLAVLTVLGVGSSRLLRTEAFRDLLGQESQGESTGALPVLDIRQAPLVDENMARRAAEKRLSDIPALGSQAYVGKLEKQVVRGRMYWIGFLEHRDFWKWRQANTTPGYVMVSAHDPSDVELVTEVGGKKLALKYIESAYFHEQADRAIRFSGHVGAIMLDLIPEVDDDGRPFLVAPVARKSILMSGSQVAGVLVLDVQDGATRYYDIGSVPAWIDRAQPQGLVTQQLQDKLYLVNGWLNPSDSGRLRVSGKLDVVYGTNGRAYYFGGITSMAKDGGIVAFSLIDSRTKESVRYPIAGITEEVAKHVAQGVIPEKGYRATNPLPFVSDGHPAYVMALTEATGVTRAYAMVSIIDQQKVAVAETLVATARLFQEHSATDRSKFAGGGAQTLLKAHGRVERIASEVRSGNTSYKFMLDSTKGRFFSAGEDISEELAITHAGDEVEVSYQESSGSAMGVLTFKNATIGLAGAVDGALVEKVAARH